MKKVFLETNRVYLKEISKNDSHLLLDLDSDPEVMKYLTDGKPSTIAEVEEAMTRILLFIDKYQYKFGFWLAYTKDTNEFMGWFLFRPCKKHPDDLQNIELGYRLKKKFWGQGFASEVSKALLKVGFADYKVDSIFATAMKKHLGSQGVMKKVGMKWEEDYIENQFPGEDKTAVRFRITRKEWEQSNS